VFNSTTLIYRHLQRPGCAITYTLFRARIRAAVRSNEVIKIPFIRYSGCSKQMTYLANSTGSNFPFHRWTDLYNGARTFGGVRRFN